MKILNCSQNHFIQGGSDKYFFDLSSLLEDVGHSVVPFCASSDKSIPSRFSEYFPVSADFDRPGLQDLIRYVYNTRAASALERLLLYENVDLAHLHIYYGKLTSSILPVLRKKDIPIIQTLHEYKLVCPVYTMIDNDGICHSCAGNRFYYSLLKRCNRGSVLRSAVTMTESYISLLHGSQSSIDLYIAVSDFQKNEFIKMGVSEDKIHTVHNFVDYSRYVVTPGNEGYFLYFGRIEKIKGIDVLLEAFELMPDIRLIILGGGSYLNAAIQYCKEREIDNIEFIGHVEESGVRDYLSGSIATLAPSIWYETFGLTLIESMSCGKPVIASRIGGMQEIISDGIDGYLVAPGDLNQLKDRVKYLYDNPASAEEMGLQGRRKVEEKFSPLAHLQKIEEIYNKFI